MEDDERREDEEQHRRQRVARPQLEPEVLARERATSREVPLMRARSRRRSRAARPAPDRGSSSDDGRRPASSRELAVEQLRALGVERGERLVEHEQLGIVQQRAAEREPLHHPARVRGDALVADVPEPEALEQHPDPLAPLRHAVEAPVEVEVLERGQLAVERAARGRGSRAGRGRRPRRARRPSAPPGPRRAGAASSCPDPFAPVTTRKPPRSSSKSSGRRRAPPARSASRRAARAEIISERRRASDEAEEDDADHAVDREERRVEPAQVAGPDERVLVGEQRRDRRDAEPVRRRRRRARARRRRAARPRRGGAARAPRNTPRSPKRTAHECSPCSRSCSTSKSE